MGKVLSVLCPALTGRCREIRDWYLSEKVHDCEYDKITYENIGQNDLRRDINVSGNYGFIRTTS